MEQEFTNEQLVYVRSWEDMKGEYGISEDGSVTVNYIGFLPEMKHLCGKKFKYYEKEEKVFMPTEVIDGNINYNYQSWMFETKKDKANKTIDLCEIAQASAITYLINYIKKSSKIDMVFKSNIKVEIDPKQKQLTLIVSSK